MADSDDQPTLVDLAALPASERRVLAGLAVVGQATLSTDEVAFLAEVEDIHPLLDDLRRRGLIRSDVQDRHGLLGAVGADIRKTNEALETGNRLLGFFKTLARGGKLTPARLLLDAEAILGLTEWSAEVEEWTELLDLVMTVQASFSLVEQVDQWLRLLNSGLGAARVLGDQEAEAAILEHLSTASMHAGDEAAARRYARQAAELRRGPVTYVAAPLPPPPPPPSPWTAGKIALLVAGFIAVAVLGLGAGVLLAGNDDTSSPSVTVPVTLTIGGETSVTVETATLPAETVIETVVTTATETLTETLVTTETVVTTTTVPIG